MNDDTIKLDDFIASAFITATATPTDRNPNMNDGETMAHWRVTLRRPGNHKMTVYFSMGSGHHGKAPEAADVLDCLASDAAGIENAQSFEDWCGEYGYDTDSRKAFRTFNVCKREAERLRKFLDTGYERLLWNTERL
jgi:hypothetical protein